MDNEHIIGVLGGMGPEATASFFYKLIHATKVNKDQDHYRVVIDSNPKIPDRTKAIFKEGESPVPYMIETAKNVERSGASVLVSPCVTSYYFMKDVQKEVNIPIINIFSVLADYLEKELPEVEKIGILCTSGTRKTALFDQQVKGLAIAYPSRLSQEEKVMEAIYGKAGIKQGNTGEYPKRLLQETAQEMIEEGADAIICGCTEVELALQAEDVSVPLIDPMQVVAERLTTSSLSFSYPFFT